MTFDLAGRLRRGLPECETKKRSVGSAGFIVIDVGGKGLLTPFRQSPMSLWKERGGMVKVAGTSVMSPVMLRHFTMTFVPSHR